MVVVCVHFDVTLWSVTVHVFVCTCIHVRGMLMLVNQNVCMCRLMCVYVNVYKMCRLNFDTCSDCHMYIVATQHTLVANKEVSLTMATST